MKRIIASSILAVFLSSAYADHVINTETNSWKNIPIKVDEDSSTFTMSEGILLPEGDYYYSFTGYRCLKAKSKSTDEEPLVLKSTDSKHGEIYCYKDM